MREIVITGKENCHYIITNRDKEIAGRDEFLETNPKNPEQWIRAKSPQFGLEIKNLSQENEASISVKLALKEVWGLSGVSNKKIIGIVVTVTIELRDNVYGCRRSRRPN